MSRPVAFVLALALLPLGSAALTAPAAVARPSSGAVAPPLPRPGVVLLSPSLAQLRPLVGRVIRITLTNGKQVNARLTSVWPGVVQLTFADGQSGAVDRRRIRSVTYLGPRFTPLAAQNAADSGRLFYQLGLGLTLGGLVVGGAAAPPLFLVGTRQACPGTLDCVPPATTAAIFVTTLSTSALVAGVPLWVVGAVRRSVHGRVGPAAQRARRRYRAWGIGLTIAGAGIGAAGGALLGVGLAQPSRWGGLRWAGLATGTLGIFVALCVGLPMWMEATGRPTAEVHTGQRILEVDPAHLRRAAAAPRHPGARGVQLSHAWQF